MDLPYDPHEVEERWRAHWRSEGRGVVDLDATPSESLFYNLAEFPYPSAEGLHIGHVFKYCGVDVFGRYRRMRGQVVFQPIGFDAFGIHTENFALRRGQHPKELTTKTVENFRRQLSTIGCAWDWSREIDTSRPEYYRWTQWLLVQLFRAGLMYQAEAPVVWCPSCLTVLAREQTEDGGTRCERCGTHVTERLMRQWFLRITDYADRLVAGLDKLDWPERAKRLQRAWIGRSEGREIDFFDLTAFTTRPETLPAVTFLAVAPGHPAAGETRPHPLTGALLPVVAAAYVLAEYGTGVVMGVPAHDERDRRFALEHDLPTSDAALLVADGVARVGRPAVRYRLRDWLISRQRYWGPPIPIVHCARCGPVPVPEDELPVLLPDVEEFRPTGTGQSPLAAATEWGKVECPACGGPAHRETDVSDTFVDSAWYFLRYPSTEFDERPWDAARTAKVLPVEFYAGGPEHVQRHHLYARFVTMALHDLGQVGFEEPFPTIRLGGFIVHQGAKMSKSRGNVVTPDEFVERHGSDVLRCALLFSAPWEAGGDFQLDAIAGIERFFIRVWRVVTGPDDDADASLDRVVRDIGDAIERLHFNVGLARLMELTPQARSDKSKRVLVRLLAPFAPHLAEELWHRLGETGSVHDQPWPDYDANALLGAEAELAIQVDGRTRDRIVVPTNALEATVMKLVRNRPRVEEALAGRQINRVVYVPQRLLNLVTTTT
jgi:leucyl-tRNA synthetase